MPSIIPIAMRIKDMDQYVWGALLSRCQCDLPMPITLPFRNILLGIRIRFHFSCNLAVKYSAQYVCILHACTCNRPIESQQPRRVFVCGSVTTITRNCVHRSSPNWV